MTNLVSTKLVSALALSGCAFFPLYSRAQETVSEIEGAKASVTITLTLTEEVGGYFIKTPKPKSEEEEAPAVPYEEILNPRGFDPTALSKADQLKFTEANYYVTKSTIKYRAKDGETGEGIDPTEETTTNLKNLRASKYGNAQFLADLVGRGVIPADEGVTVAKAIEGYGIVAVQFLGEETIHFFVEKKNVAPIFIGSTEDSSGALALAKTGGVSSLNEIATTKRKYKKVVEDSGSEGEPPYVYWEEDGDPTETYSKSSNVEQDAEFVLRRGDDSAIYVSGVLKYATKFGPRAGHDITTSLNATVAGSAAEGVELGTMSPGSEDEGSVTGLSIYGTVSGTIKTGMFATSTNLSAYREAAGL